MGAMYTVVQCTVFLTMHGTVVLRMHLRDDCLESAKRKTTRTADDVCEETMKRKTRWWLLRAFCYGF